MTPAIRRTLLWTPRVLVILFAAFTSLFALDVFEEGRGFWGTATALAIHLIPTALIVLVLVAAWNHEWVGAVLFVVLGVLYCLWARRLDWILFIAGPLFVLGGLFLVDWIKHDELRAAH